MPAVARLHYNYLIKLARSVKVQYTYYRAFSNLAIIAFREKKNIASREGFKVGSRSQITSQLFNQAGPLKVQHSLHTIVRLALLLL